MKVILEMTHARNTIYTMCFSFVCSRIYDLLLYLHTRVIFLLENLYKMKTAHILTLSIGSAIVATGIYLGSSDTISDEAT